MTPNHDVVQKLLGAVKLMREKAEAGILDNEWGINSDAACQLVIEDADKIIAQTEAQLAGESAPPYPINACIRAAKRVIAALNLPEGAGVAWDESGWYACTSKPMDTESGWFPDEGDEMWTLPDTAIPPWPGDFRESWITSRTPEIE